MDPLAYVPFCGAPPEPGALMSRWLLDPLLLAGLAVALGAGLWLARDRRLMAGGWVLVALLFVSPLCALSMALFSARVAQHLLLTLVAAPMIAAALPSVRLPPLLAAGLFAAAFWVWHAPGPYAATLEGDLVYWAMHLSLFGAAVLLWSALAAAVRDAPFAAFLAVAVTAAQMTLYAVLIVLSPSVWHVWHLGSAPLWGLSALEDQALAGGLMWVGGGLLMAATVALVLSRRFLAGTGSGSSAFPGRERST
jgi:putative membrane protein